MFCDSVIPRAPALERSRILCVVSPRKAYGSSVVFFPTRVSHRRTATSFSSTPDVFLPQVFFFYCGDLNRLRLSCLLPLSAYDEALFVHFPLSTGFAGPFPNRQPRRNQGLRLYFSFYRLLPPARFFIIWCCPVLAGGSSRPWCLRCPQSIYTPLLPRLRHSLLSFSLFFATRPVCCPQAPETRF